MNTLKFGNGEWYGKKDTILAYNDENSNFKPLPFSFDRASSATRVNKDGLIEVVTNNKPRIDYLNNSNGALLLEPSRTNLVTYSEDFSQWTRSLGVIVTDNTTDLLSPSGEYNASKIEYGGSNRNLFQAPTMSGNYSGFFYVKGTEGETIRMSVGGNEQNFTLSGDWDIIKIENVTASANTINVNTFGGATARTIYLWGAQLEQGSYATSYIPTQGATATRVDESCNGAGNDQVINSTEGVFYVEISALANDGEFKIVSFKNSATNTYANTINITYSSTANQIIAVYRVGTSSVVVLSKTLNNAIDFNKVAFKYKSGDFALWINGVKEGVNSNTTMISGVTLDEVTFYRSDNSSRFFGKTKDLRVYNTALTDAELQALTTI
jgi:hypothetical protein